MSLGQVSRLAVALAVTTACISPSSAHRALAGEAILYEPAATWVKLAELPTQAATGTSPILVLDMQQKIEPGRLWRYSDTAVRISSPEMLGQFSTVGAQWSPDQGDLIVHEISILRDGKTIDLIKNGMKLDVLRREQNLEQRELNGVLSATAAIQDLRVGDVFRLRYTVNAHDEVLGDRVQSVIGLPTRPMLIGSGRVRAIWPVDMPAKWQILAKDLAIKPVRRGDTMELEFPIPLAKQPEMPNDAPARFKPEPILELTTFKDWAEVSTAFAPLYATGGLILPGSPLATEADRIAATSTDPLTRAQAALQLVQDKVRYLAVSMDGGNYRPQSPQETWQLRYGDCKAKTLLLLALLERLGIESEAVIATVGGNYDIERHLPTAAAFNHVIVRAKIGDKTLWLDGTGIGSRIEDIQDTPDFGYVLPLRPAGAQPEYLKTHANVRPSFELTVDYDESTSIDLPAVASSTLVMRGPQALNIGMAANTLEPDQRDELVRSQLQSMLGEGQFTDLTLEASPETATVTLKGKSILNTGWKPRDHVNIRKVDSMLANFQFAPDRARAEWRDLPVSTPQPFGFAYHVRIKLPDAGKGYTLEGLDHADVTIGGTRFVSRANLAGGIFTYDERRDTTGIEVPVAQIAPDRALLAKAKAQIPQVVAPADATRRWNISHAAKGATQSAAIEAILAKSTAAKEPDAQAWLTRASVRQGIGDFKGARMDLDKAIALSADPNSFYERAQVNQSLGDLPAALADAQRAQELDPAHQGATSLLASLLGQLGKVDEARTLLDEKIALGGDQRQGWEMTKVQTLGLYADSQEALSLLDTMMTRRPQSPDLLNLVCWIKGMRDVDLEGAVRQCSSAVELASSPVGALDSRALVWFRLGRYDDAIRDLDAALLEAPSQAPSRYMRGVVLSRMGRTAESKAEIAVAHTLDPGVGAPYARHGIKP